MEILSTQELVSKLKEKNYRTFEISMRNGILSSTKQIYWYKKHFYLFGIDDRMELTKENAYTEKQFLKLYPTGYWKIEIEF